VTRFEVFLVNLDPTVRLVRKLGRIGRRTAGDVLRVLQEMFAP